MGRGAVPRAGHAAGRWSVAHEAGASIWLPHLAIERWAKTSDLPPDDPVVLTVEGTHGLDHPCRHQGRRRARREGRRAADRCAGARSGAGRGSCRSGRRCGVGAAAREMGRPLVAAGRGGWAMDCGSTSAALRICSAASAGWCAISSGGSRALGLTARVAIAPTGAAAWALARSCSPASVAAMISEGKAERRCTSLRSASMPTRCGRSSGWASRPSARCSACRGSRSRGGFAGRRTWSMRSTGRWAASPSR